MQHLARVRPRRAPAGLRKPLDVVVILLPLPFTLYALPPNASILLFLLEKFPDFKEELQPVFKSS